MIYYAKNAKYPTAQNDFSDLVQGNWPGVPTGKFIIAQVLKKGGLHEIKSDFGYGA
jgi:hypothetical protein